MTAKTGLAVSQEPQPMQSAPRRVGVDLDARYGEIGIVAVAAAVRYARARQTADPAPAASQIDQRFIELGR